MDTPAVSCVQDVYHRPCQTTSIGSMFTDDHVAEHIYVLVDYPLKLWLAMSVCSGMSQADNVF